MAALTIHAARAARAESERLRVDAQELKLAVHRSLCLATARKERAETAAVTFDRLRRALPAASPWSSLEWLHDDEELRRVLVPVD